MNELPERVAVFHREGADRLLHDVEDHLTEEPVLEDDALQVVPDVPALRAVLLRRPRGLDLIGEPRPQDGDHLREIPVQMIRDLLVRERSRRKLVLPGLGDEPVDDPFGVLLDELREGELHDVPPPDDDEGVTSGEGDRRRRHW